MFYLFFSVVSANQTEMSSDNSLCDDEVAYTPEYQPYTELNWSITKSGNESNSTHGL